MLGEPQATFDQGDACDNFVHNKTATKPILAPQPQQTTTSPIYLMVKNYISVHT